MTATMCSNFGGFRCSPPSHQRLYPRLSLTLVAARKLTLAVSRSATKKKKEMDSRRKKMGETDKKSALKGMAVNHRKVVEHAESDEESAATIQLNSELTEMCKFMEKITMESEAARWVKEDEEKSKDRRRDEERRNEKMRDTERKRKG